MVSYSACCGRDVLLILCRWSSSSKNNLVAASCQDRSRSLIPCTAARSIQSVRLSAVADGALSRPSRPPALHGFPASGWEPPPVSRLTDRMEPSNYILNMPEMEADFGDVNQRMTGLISRCRWPDVWKVYQGLRAAESEQLSEATCNALWQAALEARYITHAEELFEVYIQRKGFPCQRSYVTIISRLLKVKGRGLPHREAAYRLWKQLEASCLSLGAELDAASFRTGMNACVETGRIQEAIGLMSHMRDAKIRPGHGAYNIIIKHWCRSGNMPSALKAFKEMRFMGYSPDIITYNTLVNGFAQTGDLLKSRAMIDKARYEGHLLDVKSYSPYLLAAAKKGDLESVRSTLEEMRRGGIHPNAWCYAALIEAHVSVGDLLGAEAAVAEMGREDSRQMLKPSSVVYNLLIGGYLQRGGEAGRGRVSALLLEMTQKGLPLGVDTYCLLMNAAAASGEEYSVLRVQELLQAMRSRGLAPDSVQLSTLSKALIRQGRGAEAVEAADELEACANASLDLVALNQRVHLLSREGRMDEAEKAADRALLAAALYGRPPPVEAFGALVRGYYRMKKLKPLVAAFRRFLRAGGRPHRKMANAVVRLCLVSGETSTALQAIRAMKLLDVDMDVDMYRNWVMQVHRKQRSTGSFQNAFQSQSPGAGGGGVGTGFSSGPLQSYRTLRDMSPAAEALERLKWFLGLPNDYYSSDWRGGEAPRGD